MGKNDYGDDFDEFEHKLQTTWEEAKNDPEYLHQIRLIKSGMYFQVGMVVASALGGALVWLMS